ncbi:MAG: F0F1 ATP synthase subunit B [Zetaproteobacteria bacterium]|nr:F0F1 ATP synthase subunit B [Zetaproteobacteria bacterium]
MSIDLTFIGQIVVFLTMVVLLKKHLYVPLNEAMESRTKKIAEGLAAADAGNKAREAAEKEVEAQLIAARNKAQEIVASAEKRAAEVAESATNKARDDASKIVEAAKEEVAAEAVRARDALRSEVASIAMLAAEKVLGAEIDAKRHAALVEGVIRDGFVK